MSPLVCNKKEFFPGCCTPFTVGSSKAMYYQPLGYTHFAEMTNDLHKPATVYFITAALRKFPGRENGSNIKYNK